MVSSSSLVSLLPPFLLLWLPFLVLTYSSPLYLTQNSDERHQTRVSVSAYEAEYAPSITNAHTLGVASIHNRSHWRRENKNR
ncbi:hypothetical protein V8C42DRAFT_164729 [Trichoderma barbatum]